MIRFFEIFLGGAGWCFYMAPVLIGGIFNAGSAVGLLFFGGLFLWGVFRPRLTAFLKELRKKKVWKILTTAVCVCLLAGLIAAAAESAVMISAANSEPPADSTVIVLGCGVNGEKPSKTLRTRIAAAAEYLESHPGAVCIVSGGQGENEDISEAECMARELTALGVDPGRILKEDRSTSTRENLAFSKEILEKRGLGADIAVVTNEYHELRAGMIAKKEGLNAYAVPAASPWGLLPVYWTRELLAVAAQFLLG